MKSYSPGKLDRSVWMWIDSLLWSTLPTEVIRMEGDHEVAEVDPKAIDRFHSNHAFDGLFDTRIRTSKLGGEIDGKYSVLPSCEIYEILICFHRPHFNSVSSLTPKKLSKAMISMYQIDTVIKKTYIELTQ